jgi:hypothetical protein
MYIFIQKPFIHVGPRRWSSCYRCDLSKSIILYILMSQVILCIRGRTRLMMESLSSDESATTHSRAKSIQWVLFHDAGLSSMRWCRWINTAARGCVAVNLALEPAEDLPEQRSDKVTLIRIKSHVRYQITHSRRKDATG